MTSNIVKCLRVPPHWHEKLAPKSGVEFMPKAILEVVSGAYVKDLKS